MRRPLRCTIYCLVLAGLLFPMRAQPTRAQSEVTLRHFEAGNAHYAEGQFNQAIEAYHRALDTDDVSGALLYNLGNAYVQTGQLGQAILYYEKARRLLPNDSRLLHSLEIARSRAEAPAPPDRRPLQTVTDVIDVSWTFASGIALYLVGLALLGYRRWRGGAPSVQLGARTAVTVGLIVTAAALATSYVQTLDRRGVVLADDVPLHSSPIDRAPRDTTLNAGTLVELQRQQSGWREVRLPNGLTGWLLAETLGEV